MVPEGTSEEQAAERGPRLGQFSC